MVANVEGLVVKTGAAKQHPEVTWDSDFFDGIRGRPWDPLARNDQARQAIAGEAVHPDEPVVRIDRTEDIIPQVREVKITSDIIARFGYSTGCRKCEAIRAGDGSAQAKQLSHSRECRLRVEKFMENDALLKPRLDQARRRRDENIVKRVGAGDSEAGPSNKRRETIEEMNPNVG